MNKRRHKTPHKVPYQSIFGVTTSGKGILLAIFFVVLASAIIPAFGVLTCLLALLLVAGMVGYLYRPRVTIDTELPSRILAGERITFAYRVKNISRLRTFHLSFELPNLPDSFLCIEEPPTIPCLNPKDTIQVNFDLAPQRRGHYTLSHPVCRSTFPFHLFSYGLRQKGKTKHTVLPAFDRIQINDAVNTLQVQHNVSAPMYAQRHSLEYASNRPFLSGDSLRNIDSRAWARLARPVVKEFHHEMYRHVAIVLSTAGNQSAPSLHTESFTEDALEAAISLCASIAYSLDVNTVVDYLTIGTDLHDLRSFAKQDRVAYIHDTLAEVTPSSQTISLDDSLFEHLVDLPGLFVVCLAPEPELGQVLTAAQYAGCHVMTVVVSTNTSDLNRLPDTWPKDSRWLSPNMIMTKKVKQL